MCAHIFFYFSFLSSIHPLQFHLITRDDMRFHILFLSLFFFFVFAPLLHNCLNRLNISHEPKIEFSRYSRIYVCCKKTEKNIRIYSSPQAWKKNIYAHLPGEGREKENEWQNRAYSKYHMSERFFFPHRLSSSCENKKKSSSKNTSHVIVSRLNERLFILVLFHNRL